MISRTGNFLSVAVLYSNNLTATRWLLDLFQTLDLNHWKLIRSITNSYLNVHISYLFHSCKRICEYIVWITSSCPPVNIQMLGVVLNKTLYISKIFCWLVWLVRTLWWASQLCQYPQRLSNSCERLLGNRYKWSEEHRHRTCN